MLFWQEKPAFGLTSKDVNVLTNAQEYRTQLLRLISNAKKRIYITALYLQDDEAGREILEALHRVSLANPNLEIKVLVDFHRAQRGLIGAKKSDGNASLYCDYLEKFKSNVQVYGVPVKAKELFGVLHLKGFVVDDTLLYSGASLNNVYLQYNERYRLDRYFLVDQAALCDSVVDFIESKLIGSQAVPRIDTRPLRRLIDFKFEQKQLMRELKSASYANPTTPNTDPLGVRLFLGLGRRNNSLNRLIKNLFDTTEQELVLYTPYFNFPAPLMRSLRRLLKQGKQVTIVVGDKTANDFYLPPSEPFCKIGALPYLYETILHKFVKSQKRHIDNGNLNVYLWKHESNSFHLKGICADRQRHLLSGHNLNPRAWGLDIENGILIEDPQQSIMQAIDNEKQEILKHCRRLTGPNDLETVENYPQPVKKLLGQAKRVKVDFIIKRFI
ncbi:MULTISPECIES: CDP-diacylglycerol--serine O-phosphatidyltransferase [unclassified Pseudoalteromonas]|uniref:CDP-diacylglycerol--serine O-phosphatidyltransferase n=1 Tax=unclassified Pseudoalteromonas TaxID=194690 RepID=UPI00235A3494|nr:MULTISPECIES: CDP-diacylglycerol--serine O-phosphatidyltransferase [unclassified Pseudoalteromonas]MDC9563159.1 CDP-diacylglycerol--serine O-phosphatidyltransferase [Pseudoalteromonas sp. GAB2316C]MDC9567481.1 CDP-diacylglycerol--serine O-phosphatidyltransferase [Pseudoalteromonas sp. GABNB9D]MDC9571821.1 CDP-diacylglycerol--serine O-phosphatidyltransferase [Pseudoalteromonas sp. GABNS16A]MDC9576161.1 CDP-diacylglycerol--serine O-phosphatidyltransferase [Pseudoalteromonas sp. GABNS16E]MDC95